MNSCLCSDLLFAFLFVIMSKTVLNTARRRLLKQLRPLLQDISKVCQKILMRDRTLTDLHGITLSFFSDSKYQDGGDIVSTKQLVYFGICSFGCCGEHSPKEWWPEYAGQYNLQPFQLMVCGLISSDVELTQ